MKKVCKDIDKHASWGKHGNGEFTVKGIFFDESPNEFKKKRKIFMDAADERVKSADGLGGFRLVSLGYICFNLSKNDDKTKQT